MYAAVKRVPFEWDTHQAYAKTLEGMAPHALNIDGDVGPVLQAIKLRSLKDIATKAGRPQLTGAEMEAMNLAGPVTGLEMMQPAGSKAPVTNFFARRAYYVNKMVVGLTGEQLLAELDRRMTESVKTEVPELFRQVSPGNWFPPALKHLSHRALRPTPVPVNTLEVLVDDGSPSQRVKVPAELRAKYRLNRISRSGSPINPLWS